MFSQQIWELYRHPSHQGSLDRFSGEGWAGSRRHGIYVRIQIEVAEEQLRAARFQTVGCVAAIASCQALLEWASSHPLQEVEAMDGDRLNDQLGGLPPGRRFCADMAVHALKKALESAQVSKEPSSQPA